MYQNADILGWLNEAIKRNLIAKNSINYGVSNCKNRYYILVTILVCSKQQKWLLDLNLGWKPLIQLLPLK